MVSFIDDHRAQYGVEPICEVVPIAPSTYYTHKAQQRDPERLCVRAKRDAQLCVEIARVWQENFQVYGVRKVWRQLRREGVAVARCTVARLMGDLGYCGAIRGKAFKKTTVANESASRAMDRVNRNFTATRPNELWVADLTYVAMERVRLRGICDRCLLTRNRWVARLTVASQRSRTRCA